MPKFTKTPQELTALSRALQTVSKCKPRQYEVVLKLSRAQIAIDKSLVPFEDARKELVKSYPAELGPEPTQEQITEYQKARAAVDAEFKKMYEEGEFEVNLPKPLQPTDINHFQEMPNPNDLAILVPMMWDPGEEVDEQPKKTKKK